MRRGLDQSPSTAPRQISDDRDEPRPAAVRGRSAQKRVGQPQRRRCDRHDLFSALVLPLHVGRILLGLRSPQRGRAQLVPCLGATERWPWPLLINDFFIDEVGSVKPNHRQSELVRLVEHRVAGNVMPFAVDPHTIVFGCDIVLTAWGFHPWADARQPSVCSPVCLPIA
jgi:hypothetical protein